MGDRSNIAIVQPNDTRVWLYGHWMGLDSIRVAGDVLRTTERLTDGPYLARQLFEEMIEGAYDKQASFGISTEMQDNEWPIIVIDPQKQVAWLEEYNWSTGAFTEISPRTPILEFAQHCGFSKSFEELAVYCGSVLTVP